MYMLAFPALELDFDVPNIAHLNRLIVKSFKIYNIIIYFIIILNKTIITEENFLKILFIGHKIYSV